MADEIKASVPLDDASNASAKASSSPGERSAPQNVLADAGSNDKPEVSTGVFAAANTPVPAPPVTAPAKVPDPTPVAPIPKPPAPIRPIQKPEPLPAPAPAATVGIPQPLAPDPIAEEVGLVKNPIVPPPLPTPPHQSQMDTDMAKILQEVQLPERREFKTASDTVSIPVPHEVPPPKPPEPQKTTQSGEAPMTSVRTLKQDLQDVVRDQKMSLVHAATLEQEKRRVTEPVPFEPVRPSNVRGILFSVALLTGLGFTALVGVYFAMRDNTSVLQAPQDSLVFAEQTYSFPLDGQSTITLKATLAQARNASNAALGSITRIVPTVTAAGAESTEPQERQATFGEFMSALGTRAPAELLRALHDEFFFGVHTVDENAPLIVVPVASYDRAFAGMLAWEKTINADLSPLFAAVPALVLGEGGIPTERAFSDLVMRNYDVRALKDDAGTVQLYYSFPTRDILVIAESPYTFTELLSRLQAERRL